MKKLTALILIFAIASMFSVIVLAVPVAVSVFDMIAEDVYSKTDVGVLVGEDYVINVLDGVDSSFEMTHGNTIAMYDLWNDFDSEDGFAFDQSFAVDLYDAMDAYNAVEDRENYKASYDVANNAYFQVSVVLEIEDYQYNRFTFSKEAIYGLHQYNQSGYENAYFNHWKINNNDCEFISMTANGSILSYSAKGTAREIYEAIGREYPDFGEYPVRSMTLYTYVSCSVSIRNYYGGYNTSTKVVDSCQYILCDPHIYVQAETEPVRAITTSSPIYAEICADSEDADGYYVPTDVEYEWLYKFAKEGRDEVDGEWYGYFEIDETKPQDLLTITGPSGEVFGIAYGRISTGDRNYISFNDMLTAKNEKFVKSFVGAKDYYGVFMLDCNVKLTFHDGKQLVIPMSLTNESIKIISPCLHACTKCGFCTETEVMLPCNFDSMMYEIGYTCTCDEPAIPEITITRESQEEVFIESSYMTVNVVIDRIEADVDEAPAGTFVANISSAVGKDNVVALFNVDVFDEGGYPYTLNQWGDYGEELTVSFTVGEEIAQQLRDGTVKLYHISGNGTKEEVTDITILGDKITFTWDDFSPFVIAKEQTEIEIELGVLSNENNTRYVEINGVVTEIPDGEKYSVAISEENLLIEVVEKTQNGDVVNTQYFYVDMEEKSAIKLDMDLYMYTYNETSIRTKNPMGIRFKSYILAEAKFENTEFVIDEYGYVITTKDYLGTGELTFDTEKKVIGVGYNRADGKDIVFESDDDKHIFTCVLKNVPIKEYKTDLVCKTYTKITIDSNQFVVYGEPVVGNIYDTAVALIESDPTNRELINIIFDYENVVGIPGDDLYN